MRKDTVGLCLLLGRWRRQVDDDELRGVRLVDDDLVQRHRRVHAPHVALLTVADISAH